MSTQVVSQEHIDFMVTVILRSEAVPEAGTDADAIGRELWQENVNSFTYCYQSRYADECPDVSQYRYTPVEIPGENMYYLFKQFDYYDYQTCEHPEWKASAAYRWIRVLMDMWEAQAEKDHPGVRIDDLPAYDRAPWGL